jgi:hypothetical protein
MTRPTRKTRLFARDDVRRQDFVDKLCERWAVEEAAVTLFKLAIERLHGLEPFAGALAQLERFGLQERRHARMLEQLLAELGRDPRLEPVTAEASIAVDDMGMLVELMRAARQEPRTVLQVLLLAERTDGAGWELLIELAKEAELDDEYLRSFRAVGREEAEHEHVIRAHLLRAERAELFAGEAQPSR